MSFSSKKKQLSEDKDLGLCTKTRPCRLHMVKHTSSLGPVVQSIVSLTSSLRGQLVKCFKTL